MTNYWKEAAKRSIKIELSPSGRIIYPNQLWNLPLTGPDSLDSTYQNYAEKALPKKSLIKNKNKSELTDEKIIMKLIEDVYNDIENEKKDVERKRQIKEQLETLMKIKEEIQLEKFKKMSLDKIEKQIQELSKQL
jgi:trehalose/maltose hydrolase-like predicted phosphorylase